MEHNPEKQSVRQSLKQMASDLWAQHSDNRTGLEMSVVGTRAYVLDTLAAMICFANEFNLLHTIVPHPHNRWWRRRHMEAMFVIRGTNEELVQYLNVLDEDLSANAG